METGEPVSARSPAWMRFIIGRNPFFTIVRIVFVVSLTLVLFKFVLIPIRVTGDSMLPTYHNGQIKFVNRLAYRGDRTPERGDVVAVRYEGEILLLKRVVALPGETMRVVRGDIYINGEKLFEPYASGKLPFGRTNIPGYTDPVTLRPSEYLVVGDNRLITEGYFKSKKEIIGKVL